MAPTCARARLLPCILLFASALATPARAEDATRAQPGAARTQPGAAGGAAAEPSAAPSAAEPAQADAPAQIDAEADEDMLDDSAAAAVRMAQVDARRKAELTLALEAVEREEQHTSRLLPLLTTGVGIALALTGIAVGAGKVLTCDDSCTMPFWPAWLVVGGGTVATAGGIWIARTDRDIAELHSQRFQIERELDYLKWGAGAPPPTAGAGAPRAAFSLRAAF